LQASAKRTLGSAELGTGPAPLRFTAEAWAAQRPDRAPAPGTDRYQPVAATGRVQRLEIRGGAGPAAGMVRDALVWTPPGYDDPANADIRYATLYLMDGQNLFERSGAIPAEWGVDETATRLIEAGLIEPVIIVGVPHAGSARAVEYLPAPAYGVEAPAGDDFVGFLSDTVVPRVDRAFRTRPERTERYIGGASLGAIISLHAAAQRSDLFGGVLLESPSTLGRAQAEWLAALKQHGRWPDRAYVGVGDNEGDGAGRGRIVRSAEQIAAALEESGAQMRLVIEAGAEHDERAWARRFPEAMQFLLGTSDR
ncbi:MAG: alpha/beta hydrolase, partial [Phycisphaerales bacterium JB039]